MLLLFDYLCWGTSRWSISRIDSEKKMNHRKLFIIFSEISIEFIICHIIEKSNPLGVLRVGLLAYSSEVFTLKADGTDTGFKVIISVGAYDTAWTQALIFGNHSNESILFEELG